MHVALRAPPRQKPNSNYTIRMLFMVWFGREGGDAMAFAQFTSFPFCSCSIFMCVESIVCRKRVHVFSDLIRRPHVRNEHQQMALRERMKSELNEKNKDVAAIVQNGIATVSSTMWPAIECNAFGCTFQPHHARPVNAPHRYETPCTSLVAFFST